MKNNKQVLHAAIPLWVKWSHFGLVVFGVSSYTTAELAEHSEGFGYYIHAYLGLTLLVFLLSRAVYGVTGQKHYRFSSWSPFNKAYLSSVKEDLSDLSKLNIPDRQDHRGLSGLVQMFGLIVFSWMAITGTAIYFMKEKNGLVYDFHEVGESLVPLFLFIHVGAVVIHVLSGKKILNKMFPFISRFNT
jgi:cytochrome b